MIAHLPTRRGRESRPSGFTLTELLVVILIITLVSAATLPGVFAAINERELNDAAGLVQATLTAARDAAISSRQARGIRLLPDPTLTGSQPGIVVANRMVAIEQPPDYAQGKALLAYQSILDTVNDPDYRILLAVEQRGTLLEPNEPTGWFWNIRQGEKIRIGNSGRLYTIAGPIRSYYSDRSASAAIVNADRHVNFDTPPASSTGTTARFLSMPINVTAILSPPYSNTTLFQTSTSTTVPASWEVLFLVNGEDDDGDGFVDESFDGIDNNGDGVTDPGFDGLDNDGNGSIDDALELFYNANATPRVPNTFPLTAAYLGEYEPEKIVGTRLTESSSYVITGRHAVVREGANEVALPQGVVVDLTTHANPFLYNRPAERSRLPVDYHSYFVDILFGPNGQVVDNLYGNSVLPQNKLLAYYQFWLTERDDVFQPLRSIARTPPATNPTRYDNVPYDLPMPSTATNYPNTGDDTNRFLTKDRRLVTLFPRTGQITVNSIEKFNGTNVNIPFLDAQSGTREPK